MLTTLDDHQEDVIADGYQEGVTVRVATLGDYQEDAMVDYSTIKV